jgi:hypothetical protein
MNTKQELLEIVDDFIFDHLFEFINDILYESLELKLNHLNISELIEINYHDFWLCNKYEGTKIKVYSSQEMIRIKELEMIALNRENKIKSLLDEN